MKLHELMDVDALNRLRGEGYINAVVSPDARHILWNYTEKATYERVWTPETRQCRGLITDLDDTVVCLPFAKFANLGEPGFPECGLEALSTRAARFDVTEKLDGSMVAVWYDVGSGCWRCTTRGSFTSRQAKDAQEWLDQHTDWSDWPASTSPDLVFTFIGEWCAPDNRIVLAYDKPELRLIGVRVIDHGHVYDLSHVGVRAWAYHLRLPVVNAVALTLAELQAHQQTATGCEGWVLRWDDGFRVKVKTADYLRLHKALSGFGPKQVYEVLCDDRADWEAYERGLPEEIQPDALRYCSLMMDAVVARAESLAAVFEALAPLLAAGRRDFALAVQREGTPADRPILFALADGKPIFPILWKQLDWASLCGAVVEREGGNL